MSDIPKTRELIQAARKKIQSRRRVALAEAADLPARAEQMMWRDPPSHPKAPPQFGMTDRQKDKIRSLKARHPRMQLREIAFQVGTAIGRVSEVLNGKR